MDVDRRWPRLDQTTRQWLINHNGKVLPAELVSEIELAGGADAFSSTSSNEGRSTGAILSDSIVDRIEALANDEQ